MQSKPPLQEVPSGLAATPMTKAPSIREGLCIASGCLLILSWFPSGVLAQGLESKPSPTAADVSPSPSTAVSQASPKPISTATPAEPPSQEVIRDINALLNKSSSEARNSSEVKGLSEVRSPSETEGPSEAKSPSEVRSPSEAKGPSEVKGPSDWRKVNRWRRLVCEAAGASLRKVDSARLPNEW